MGYKNIDKIRRKTAAGFIAAGIALLLILNPFGAGRNIFTGAGLSFAASDDNEAFTPPAWPQEHSDLKPDADLYFGRLENGFRFVLMQNKNPKDRVSMHLDVQAGSAYETDDQQGLAHFLEHLLFCGSENFAPGELVKYFQSIGMQFGADANAHTGFYETVYDILLPRGDEENLRQGLKVMKDYAQGALLLPSEIDRERNVILAEKRARDSAAGRTYEATIKFELPEAIISRRLPIGKEDVIQRATQADLKAYYDTWYRPDTMVLVAVGDFRIPAAVTLIREYFSDMRARSKPVPPLPFGEIRHNGLEAFHHYEKESGNTTVTLEVLTKETQTADTIDRRKEQVKKEMADQIVQNRLDAMISRGGAPGTSAAIGSGVYLNHVRYAMVTAEGEPGNWEQLLAFLEKTVRKAIRYGFTEAELERVRRDFLAELDQAVKKKETRESKVLARNIIRQINAHEVILSPEDEKKLLAPYISQLRLSDLHQAFQESWQPDHRLILVTGNADLAAGGKSPEDLILQAYAQSRKTAVKPPSDKQAVTFPYLSAPQGESRVKDKIHDSNTDIVQIDYANGFRLNLKRTTYKNDEILASLAFGRGRSQEPAEHPGLADLATSVINESGLGRLTQDELDAALAGKQTRVSFSIQTSAFVFNGESVPEELELLFQLLYAHVMDPGFRSNAYQLSMAQFKSRYESISHTLQGAMVLDGNRFLAGGDSRFGLPSQEAFERLSLRDVRRWIEPALSREPLELSLVGDFDTDRAVALAARYFGAMPERSGAPMPKERPVEFPDGRSSNIRVETKIPSGLVVVAYPTEDIWDIHKTRRFSVLADVFSERMRVRIRNRLGEAYSPYAFNRASRAYSGYGVFQAVVEVDPAKAQLVVDEIKKIAAELAQNGITRDEIQRSLKPTLHSIRDMRQRNEYWLKTVLQESKKHPEQIEWSRHILEDYAAINAEDLQKLAREYLRNDRAAVIVATPGSAATPASTGP